MDLPLHFSRIQSEERNRSCGMSRERLGGKVEFISVGRRRANREPSIASIPLLADAGLKIKNSLTLVRSITESRTRDAYAVRTPLHSPRIQATIR